MIKFKLHILMAKKGRLRVKNVVDMTGLATNTVTGIYKDQAKMIALETLDKLCKALNCTPGDLLEYVPDPE